MRDIGYLDRKKRPHVGAERPGRLGGPPRIPGTGKGGLNPCKPDKAEPRLIHLPLRDLAWMVAEPCLHTSSFQTFAQNTEHPNEG